MPIMSGTVHDEVNFVAAIAEYFSGPPRHAITADEFRNFVTSSYPAETARRIFAEYKLTDYPTPQRAWNAAGTDGLVCPQLMLNRILAPQVPVYAYEFNDATAPFFFPAMPGFEPLAYHTADIQYLFPLWHGGPRRHRPPPECAAATSVRCSGEGLDEFRAERRPERAWSTQVAGLQPGCEQARRVPLGDLAGLRDDHGPSIRCRAQVRLLGEPPNAAVELV